jgi:hypothetical protein
LEVALKKTIAVALTTAGVITGGLAIAVPAAATAPYPVTASSARVDARFKQAQETVARFMSEYVNAATGGGSSENPDVRNMRRLRERYFTPELNKKLDRLAVSHGYDPVFQAQEVPDNWDTPRLVARPSEDSVELALNEAWGDPNTTFPTHQLVFTVRLTDQKITDLR